MLNQVNVAIQVIPMGQNSDTYHIVDKAIEVIQQSNLKHIVTPFETVIEGPYDEIMAVAKKVQEVCYNSGAQQVMCYLKIQSDATNNVTIEDKIEKYT